MLHQHPSPVLRVVCLTAAVLGKQCENKKSNEKTHEQQTEKYLGCSARYHFYKREKKEGGNG